MRSAATAAKASSSSVDGDGVLRDAEPRELGRGRLDVQVAGEPAGRRAAPTLRAARMRRPPRARCARDARCPAASDGEAVTVAKGVASRTRALASITAATCDELTVACACVSPSGSRSIVGPFQIDERRVEAGERARGVARGRRHRGREDDDVRRAPRGAARSRARRRRRTPASRRRRRRSRARAARRSRARSPRGPAGSRAASALEEREVARDDARPSAARTQSRCQSSS